MKELTGESFAEMLTLCSQHSHFKVGIIFDKRHIMSEFLADIKEIGSIPGISKSRVNKDYGRFEFYNGSIIEVLPYRAEELRARNTAFLNGEHYERRFNQVLYHFVDDMTEDIRNMIRVSTVSYVTDEENAAKDAVLFAAKFGMMNEVSKIKDELRQMEDDTSEELDNFLGEFKVSENRE